jgi:hypothetical protein
VIETPTEPPKPVDIEVDGTVGPEKPAHPVTIGVPPPVDEEKLRRQRVDEIVALLAMLDKSFEKEDAKAFARLLSTDYRGVMTPSGRTTRKTEVDNARAFFEIASGIHVGRTTLEKDIRADEKRAEARSTVKFLFTQGGMQLSRSYVFVYTLAREEDAWRIDGMVVEREGP